MNEELNKSEAKITSELISYARDIFDQVANDFDTLDKKALGAIAVAGLLVGLNALNADTVAALFRCLCDDKCICLPFLTLCAILFHAAFLIISIIFALKAFQVTEFEYPDKLDDLPNMQDQEQLKIIYSEYKDAIDSIEIANSDKARRLKNSVITLTIAIIALLTFFVLTTMQNCIKTVQQPQQIEAKISCNKTSGAN